jgi:hypothetical protein
MADDTRHQINLAPTDAERDVFLEYAKLTGGPGADPEVFVRLVIDDIECIRFRSQPTKDIVIGGPIVGEEFEVSTTDNTVTTISTIPIADDTAVALEVRGEGVRTNGADQAAYIRRALLFRRGGGPATIEGSVSNEWTVESASAWNFTIGVSGNNCIITVKGSGSHDVDWFASVIQRERPL